MWPVSDLREAVPSSFRVYEDTEFVTLQCRCGYEALFSAAVSPEAIVRVAEEHDCENVRP